MDRIERRREHIRTVSIYGDVYGMVEVSAYIWNNLTVNPMSRTMFLYKFGCSSLNHTVSGCVTFI